MAALAKGQIELSGKREAMLVRILHRLMSSCL
jgi:hypothetical protein